MTGCGNEEDRKWAADKREFVGDARDDVADARDTAADARDSAADAREAQLDEREAQLDARASELGLTAQSTTTQSATSAAERSHGREERLDLAFVRGNGRSERDEAVARRLTEAPPTLLALAFASIAEHLYEAQTYDEVLARITRAAVATVAGADAASVTLPVDNSYRTVGPTTSTARQVDQAQYDSGEGPCLDAVETSSMVAAPSFPDERWPVLGATPTEHGVHSSISYQLKGNPGATGIGSLNIYAYTPDAFDDDAVEIGTILAAHASLAARAVRERTSLQQLDHDLEQALLSRDVIGQAKGILMERLKTTPEEAFEILKNSSQRLNVKLRQVARDITDTGEITPRS